MKRKRYLSKEEWERETKETINLIMLSSYPQRTVQVIFLINFEFWRPVGSSDSSYSIQYTQYFWKILNFCGWWLSQCTKVDLWACRPSWTFDHFPKSRKPTDVGIFFVGKKCTLNTNKLIACLAKLLVNKSCTFSKTIYTSTVKYTLISYLFCRLVHRAVSPEPLTTRKTHKTPPSRCGDRGCDCKEATSLPEHAKRNAVIEEGPNFTTKVFGDKLLGSASEHRTVFRRKKRPSITVTKPSESIADSLENQFESMLRVSPISLYGSSARLYLDGRRKSPQSVARSELQSSKWMQEDLSEYTFLPYLPNTSAKHRASRLVKQKHVETLSKPSANKNYRISLPPIKNLTFSSNYFRSISATPRHENKPSPTVSAQIGGIHKRKSQQLKPTNSSLASNEARRNSSVKYINQLWCSNATTKYC